MKQVSGKEFVRLVTRRGWILNRIKGSHHIFTLPARRERLVVPVHGSEPLKIGLLRSLMKVAGVEEKDL